MGDIIRHSDVDMVSWAPVGQHTLNPDDFRKWGATLVTWGLDSIFTKTANVPASLAEVVGAAYKGGVRAYLANLDMCSAQPWNLAKDPELREAIARDFDGNGHVVPWFPAVVDGVPAYAGCINNPVYRENVRQRVRDGYSAGCKGLHVDCADGLAGILRRHGGCYCKYCMDGFTEYLKQKYSRQHLAEKGIADVDAWDFAAEIRRVARTKEDLLCLVKGVGRIDDLVPLFPDYRAFVAQSTQTWLENLGKLNRQLGGSDAGYSINAGKVERWLALSSMADFFTCEIRHRPEHRRVPSRVIGLYRAAESLGKMLSVTAGTVGDWPLPAKGGMDNLVAMWVALAYANGHLFIVPNNVWCYSQKKGVHSYRGPEEVFLPLYRFIRRNECLLDGYEPMEQIGVVYRPGGPIEIAGTRRWVDPFSETCGRLVEAHYPFGVVFPGRSDQGCGLSAQNLKRFECVVIPEGVVLHGQERTLLESWKRDARAVPWTDSDTAVRGIDPLVRVADGKRLWVFPRHNKSRPEAPIVLHLFNPNYDAASDQIIEQTDVLVTLRPDLVSDEVSRVVFYSPTEEPRDVHFRTTEGGFEIVVPKVGLWAILRLER